jgi:hypothetical protein
MFSEKTYPAAVFQKASRFSRRMSGSAILFGDVEIPAKRERCELRQIVFGWTEVEFPFRVRSGRKLKLSQPLIVTVIGKAFFDIGHAPADHSNRRTDLQGYAAWEIHPVMKLTIQ